MRWCIFHNGTNSTKGVKSDSIITAYVKEEMFQKVGAFFTPFYPLSFKMSLTVLYSKYFSNKNELRKLRLINMEFKFFHKGTHAYYWYYVCLKLKILIMTHTSFYEAKLHFRHLGCCPPWEDKILCEKFMCRLFSSVQCRSAVCFLMICIFDIKNQKISRKIKEHEMEDFVATIKRGSHEKQTSDW